MLLNMIGYMTKLRKIKALWAFYTYCETRNYLIKLYISNIFNLNLYKMSLDKTIIYTEAQLICVCLSGI